MHDRDHPADLDLAGHDRRHDARERTRQNRAHEPLEIEAEHRPPRRVTMEENLLTGLRIHRR
jgi:hypothetical protein